MSRSGNAIYSVSKTELLDWLNALLGTNYTKVEETSNGAAFCQILDSIYPGEIKLKNVKFNPTNETEILSNYKIIQLAFTRHKIERILPIEGLIKGKFMSALETLQWFKAFYDENSTGEYYDGAARRAEIGLNGLGENNNTKRVVTTFNLPGSEQPPRTQQKSRAPGTTRSSKTTAPKYGTKTPATVSKAASAQQLSQLKDKVEQLKGDNQTLLDERNFYYDKLQAVEQLCLRLEGDEFANQILEVLYKTDEEHGFVSPDELDI